MKESVSPRSIPAFFIILETPSPSNRNIIIKPGLYAEPRAESGTKRKKKY
jgi:hypothetical protein